MKTMLAAYLPGNSTVDLREVAVQRRGLTVLIKMNLRDLRKRCPHIYHQHRATAAAPDKPLYPGALSTVMNRAGGCGDGARLPPF